MLNSFQKRKADVLNHWIALAENFQSSPNEFYAEIEREIAARKIPGLEMSRVEFSEGGILSDKRVYLRMIRERTVFDVCLAPFGVSSFFSCRTAEIPKVIQLWQILLLLFSGFIALGMSMRYIGIIYGPMFLFACMLALVYVLRNTVALGLQDLDANLIKSPVFGAIYENWFRKETYYREDTRLMYLESVPTVVRKIADDITAAKGIKLVRQYELAPILGELYKPVLFGQRGQVEQNP